MPKYKNIYMGKDSVFKIPAPKDGYRFNAYNMIAQALDFVDLKTFDHDGKRIPFVYHPNDSLKDWEKKVKKLMKLKIKI